MEPKKYIYEIRKTTITQAAIEMGVTRQWLTMVCNGSPGGRELGKRFEKWSGGEVTQLEIMFPK